MADQDNIPTSHNNSNLKINYPLMTLVFFCSGLFIVSALFATIPLHSLFSEEFDINAQTAALTTSVCSFCYAAGTVFFAPLSDRFGRKNIIVFGLIMLMIITPVIGILSSSVSLIILRGIQGFFAASFAPTAMTFMIELYPDRKRGTAIGFISAGFLMAGIIGQVYSSIIQTSFNWNYVFYIFGLIYLGLILAFFFIIPKDQAQSSLEKRSFLKKFTVVLSQPIFLYNYFITTLLLFSLVGMYTTLENYLHDTYNFGATQVLMVRAAGIIGMLVSPFGGLFVSRFGIFPMMRCGLGLAATGLFFTGLSSNIPLLLIMSILFTAGISLTVPSMISFLGYYGGKEKASAMSLYSFFLFTGSTIGPIAAVLLMSASNYTVTFSTIAGLLATGFLITFLLSKKADTIRKNGV